MDCRKRNSITVKGIVFEIHDVNIPEPKKRIDDELIGYDLSVFKNRDKNYSHIEFDEIIKILKKYYKIKKDENYFYLSDFNLYLVDRLNYKHNFNAYNSSDKFHINSLNELIEKQEKEIIETWCIDDILERKLLYEKRVNFLEIYYFYNEKDLLNQVNRVLFGLKNEKLNKELINEFNLICKEKGNYKKAPLNNKIIQTYNLEIYQNENNYYQDPIKRRNLIEKTKFYYYLKEHEIKDKDILMTVRFSKCCPSYSFFSPSWIKAFIEEFNIKSIYDPCGGWGHRLLGSWNIDYIYNDTNINTFFNVLKINEFCNTIYNNKKLKSFYNKDASILIPKERYDAVFTCPPYFNIEIYNGKNSSTNLFSNYNEWLNIWWRNVIKCSIKNCNKYFSFIINHVYKEDMKNICLEENLKLLKEIKIGSNQKTHFQRVNNSNKGEFLLVFTL